MNKSIFHLYQELSEEDKEQLIMVYDKSPKMLSYLRFLETEPPLTGSFSDRAIMAIYGQGEEETERNVLMNRFYKLRQSLHQQLLQVCRYRLTNQTDEASELEFLELLLLKNEHTYLLERAQKLEKKCWEDGLFELLPDLLHIVAESLHYSQPENMDLIQDNHHKIEKANELLYVLHQLKHQLNSFRLHTITGTNRAEIGTFYRNTIAKIKRKIRPFNQPRFELIYRYLSFTAGCFLQDIVAHTGNVLARHLNKLDQLLEQYPNTPVGVNRRNHRVYVMHTLNYQKAMYWYQKQKPQKSYEAIMANEVLLDNYPDVYISISDGNIANLLLCCFGIRQYESALPYLDLLREYQVKNNTVKHHTPYFFYELIAYSGLYPNKKHPAPDLLLNKATHFLSKEGQDLVWAHEPVAEFALLYGFLDISEKYASHPRLLETHVQYGISYSTIDVVRLVQDNDKEGLRALIILIQQATKAATATVVIHHLEDIEQLAKKFL
jgi:hypothetical protein